MSTTPPEVEITAIAAGGDGVGRLADGRAVFVPRTAPGDRVALRADRMKLHRHFARAEPDTVTAPGPGRADPVCPHYTKDACGGCQLQHLSYEAQLAAKRRIVGDALRRIGRLEVQDPEIVEAIEEWRYRAKISLAARRVGDRVVGLHRYDRPGAVFALEDCHITDVRLMALWKELRPRLDLLPPKLARLTLRLDRDGRRHLIAESAGEPWQTAERLRATLPDPDRVVCWWHPADGAPRVVAGPETGYPATAFEQVNPEMGALARRWVADQLGAVKGHVIWDLYGGVGDTAMLLAERGAQVVSVDADERASEWARRRPEGGVVRFIAARAEDALGTLPLPDAVVLNPPRAGLHWDVTLRLTSQPVARVAYLSCDPATLARDLSRMIVNYRIAAVKAFDLFPQTAHVETAVVLEAVDL
jgi:23S rRNA (uracil1939-C5)-methyltransferase